MKTMKLAMATALVGVMALTSVYIGASPNREWEQIDDHVHHRLHRAGPKAPAEAPAPRAKLAHQCEAEAIVGAELVRLNTSQPSEASLNAAYAMGVKITALKDAAKVEAQIELPAGVNYVSSDPAAMREGNMLVFRFDKMHKGDVKEFDVMLMASAEGEHKVCSTIHAIPMGCCVVRVGAPDLKIEKMGPETARKGEEVTYNIKVTNDGSAAANDVMINDLIPAGMKHKSGDMSAEYNIGNLAAGESRMVKLDLMAAETGRWCNVATASASNAGDVSDEACTLVQQPDIEISKSGTEWTYAGKKADYKIRVRNSGDLDLTNVVVTDMAPSGAKIEAADGADISGNKATWKLATLKAGDSKEWTLSLRSDQIGELCNNVSADAAEGVSDDAQACTEWKGQPAVLIEMIDMEDPLFVGEKTTYKIIVTNQGTAPDENIQIKVKMPREMDAIKASGDAKGMIRGKTVTFDTVPVLEPKATVTFYVEAKASSKGDARIRVELRTRLLDDRPVTEEESTHVY